MLRTRLLARARRDSSSISFSLIHFLSSVSVYPQSYRQSSSYFFLFIHPLALPSDPLSLTLLQASPGMAGMPWFGMYSALVAGEEKVSFGGESILCVLRRCFELAKVRLPRTRARFYSGGAHPRRHERV